MIPLRLGVDEVSCKASKHSVARHGWQGAHEKATDLRNTPLLLSDVGVSGAEDNTSFSSLNSVI